MQEAEVSLRIAIYHIINGLTAHDITVSIDGAHIRTKYTIHFDIWKFFKENHITKIDGRIDDYKGIYQIAGYDAKIIVTSTPGIGDVNVILNDGTNLYVESKKGKANKSGQEYPLMREAIGQLMTGCELGNGIIPVVAVPYSKKSFELADRWSGLPQMQKIGIKFYLVKEDGDIVIV